MSRISLIVAFTLAPFVGWLLSPAGPVDLMLAGAYLPILLLFGIRIVFRSEGRRGYLAGMAIAVMALATIVVDSIALDRSVSAYVAGVRAVGRCGPTYSRLIGQSPGWVMQNNLYAVHRMRGIGANRVLTYKVEGQSAVLRYGNYDSSDDYIRFSCVD